MSSPEAAELSLEEEIAAAMEAHREPQEAPAVVDEPEVTEEPAKGSERGPDGKFVAKADKAEEGPEITEKELPASEDAPVIPDRYGVPPNYAKAGIRESWKDLPANVRQELHEREKEFHQQLTKYDEDRNFGKQVKQVVGPYEGFIKSLGADPVQAVDYLIKTDYALRTAPPEQRKALFLNAAKDYGITFGEQEITAPANDPRMETLQQRLDRLENAERSAKEAEQLAEQRSIDAQIADFSSRPENVYFDRVSPTMAALLQSGQASSLEQAYEMAVYADPETRALQLAASAEQSQRKLQQEKADQAAKARIASASVTGAPGQAVPASSPQSAGSLEDDIRNAIAAASGRV